MLCMNLAHLVHRDRGIDQAKEIVFDNRLVCGNVVCRSRFFLVVTVLCNHHLYLVSVDQASALSLHQADSSGLLQSRSDLRVGRLVVTLVV